MLFLLKNKRQSRILLYPSGLLINWKECIVGAFYYVMLFFKSCPINSKSVLIVEFNPFHGETLPGYVDYFQELGYDVTVLTRHVTYADSPFVCMKKKHVTFA